MYGNKLHGSVVMHAQRFTGSACSVETSRLRDKIPGITRHANVRVQVGGWLRTQDCDRDAARIDRRPHILESQDVNSCRNVGWELCND